MNTRCISLPLFGLYSFASFLHFAHNGLQLADYPNMPRWITPSGVFGTWLAIAAVGVCGYVLIRLGYQVTGLLFLTLYAIAGLDGLAHYALAPIHEHSFAMNFTIGFEVLTATLLLIAIARMPRSQS